MPKGKKRGKGKGKGKGKAKGKSKGKDQKTPSGDGETRRLLKAYEKNCVMTNSQMCPGIRKLLRAAAEENKLVTKFILETVPLVKDGDLPVLFEPLIASLRQERYKHIQDIHIWDYPMSYENIASLAGFLEKSFHPMRLIELLDCLIDVETVSRLSRSFKFCEFLTTIVLDYNEFGDNGCQSLCNGLVDNISVLSLSLCYCDLNIPSGKYLGDIVSKTAIRELYLDGNELECEGAIDLIKMCVSQAELEAFEREEEAKRAEEEKLIEREKESNKDDASGRSGSEKDSNGEKSRTGSGKKKKKKGKGKRKKKKKAPPAPPPVGPWLHKLHLADNGIDSYGNDGTFAPIICMRLFKKLLMNSKCFVELDLEDNSIGEMGGREILDGLTARKEAKLGGCKVRTTHKMTSATFNAIVKQGAGLKKKGKRKGKKKGKKKKK
ncbi:uncharacterized protein LOC131947100 [Physella acuta]|uniref:uncharacterized protein LOC131947100 n=1 Tax=Physella acuta TaxID=109671 RepID=UPI0027DCAAB3|nr:uncharacterized protein LOC131947100 [Physella acuta]XP_059164172.1 uncharacterized protein LOC131947100 [Physella acuta]XP_059164173.1 uncharacterized protein LOC131947100 [Physella acuta]XP_059164174.1 uncharacterized protein LOC131947100 [Physella acuta]